MKTYHPHPLLINRSLPNSCDIEDMNRSQVSIQALSSFLLPMGCPQMSLSKISRDQKYTWSGFGYWGWLWPVNHSSGEFRVMCDCNAWCYITSKWGFPAQNIFIRSSPNRIAFCLFVAMFNLCTCFKLIYYGYEHCYTIFTYCTLF